MKKTFLTLAILLFAKTLMSVELHWKANPLEYDMILTAAVYIDEEEQQNEMLELGVFWGDDVRGSALPKLSPITNKYLYYINVYNEELTASMTFKLYNHETEEVMVLDCGQVLEFVSEGDNGDDITPYIVNFTTPIPAVTFTGEGSWNEKSNWEDATLPTETDDVVIDGDAVITGEVLVNSLMINAGKSLTIQNGGVLTVTETVINTDYDALIIEDGGQIIQTNENVAATFKKNIVVPSDVWGNLDKTGWQFVSSPVQNSLTSDFKPETGDYDLYKYDGTQELQWINYKKAIEYTFDSGLDGCTTKDADGDGHYWILADDGYVYSESYDIENDSELSPDNYLVFPAINTYIDGTTFKFKARAEDDAYPEYCGVAVSEDGTNFTMIEGASWTIGEGSAEGELSQWYDKTVSLSEYEGEQIYVAIRHYNVTGSYNLRIDDVKFCRDDESFENGIGYLVSYQLETTADFKGILNKESSYKLTANYSGSNNNLANFNLVGNPFTYNINWITDVKLVGCNDGYATLNENGGYDYKTDGTIKVGEGFMINSKPGRTHNITLQKGINSAKRSETNSINIVASGKYGSDNVIVRHEEDEDTKGFPKLLNFNEKIANVYVSEEDVNYGIYNYTPETTEIPLHFDAKEMGNYTLTFDIDGDYDNLYLIDKMTGEKANLLIENEYSFMANSTDATDRFVIMMDNGQQTTDNSHFVYVSGEELFINAEGTIQIIDMMGRVVYSNNVANDNNRIDVSGFNKAAYVVRVINEKEVKVQKVIL